MAGQTKTKTKLPPRLRYKLAHRNRLLRIIAIQSLYLTHKAHEGVRDSWIFTEHIYPVYYISRATFMKYMATNAKKQLTDLDAEITKLEEECKGQLESKTS